MLSSRYIYLEFKDGADFEKQREAMLETKAAREYEEHVADFKKEQDNAARNLIAEDTPIYHDEDANCYYYPKIACTETVKVRRELVPFHKHNLHFDKATKKYFRKENNQEYVKVGSKEEFELLRKQELEANTKIPIYKTKDRLYFPKIALLERDEVKRLEIPLGGQLVEDPEGGGYLVDKKSNLPYVELKTKVGFSRIGDILEPPFRDRSCPPATL